MSLKSSRNSLQDQLMVLSIDIDDKEKNCKLLQRKVDAEMSSLKALENSIKEEFGKQYDVKVQELQGLLSDLEMKSGMLFTEKINVRKSCEEVIAAMNEDEKEYSAAVATINRESDRQVEKERKKFKDGYKDRLDKFMALKALEVKEATNKGMQSQFNRLQMNHDQEIAEVDTWLRNEEKLLQDILSSRQQTEEDQERLAAKDELRMSLKAVVDKGKEECDAESKEQLRALRALQESLDKDLDKQRAQLQEKAGKLRRANQIELKNAQESSQQRIADLKATHTAYIERVQNDHEEQIRQLKKAAKQSLALAEASYLKEQRVVLADSSEEDSEGEGSSKVSPAKRAAAAAATGKRQQDPLSQELAQRKRDAEVQRDKQLQNELRALEIETLRLERSWKAKAEEEKLKISSAQSKEEEALNRRINQLLKEQEDLVLDRERLIRLSGELKQQEEVKSKNLSETKKNIQSYREGIAAHHSMMKEKESALKTRLRELQLALAPAIRTHKEHCDELEAELRRNERAAVDYERQSAERTEAEKEEMHVKFKADLDKIDLEIASLNERIETERVRSGKLLTLLKNYNNSNVNGRSSSGATRTVLRDDSEEEEEAEDQPRPALRTTSASVTSRGAASAAPSARSRPFSSTYSTASTVTRDNSTAVSSARGGGGGASSATSRLRK